MPNYDRMDRTVIFPSKGLFEPVPFIFMFHAVIIIKMMLKSSHSFLVVLARQNAKNRLVSRSGGFELTLTASGSRARC